MHFHNNNLSVFTHFLVFTLRHPFSRYNLFHDMAELLGVLQIMTTHRCTHSTMADHCHKCSSTDTVVFSFNNRTFVYQLGKHYLFEKKNYPKTSCFWKLCHCNSVTSPLTQSCSHHNRIVPFRCS